MQEDTEVVGFTDAPSEDESKQLSELGTELMTVDRKMAALQLDLAALGTRRKELTDKVLPEYFIKIGQDKLGLPGFDVDLVLENYTHANISADWEPERREAAFNWLIDNGHGDLIKVAMEILFPRTAMKLALWVQAQLKKLKLPPAFKKMAIPDAEIEMTVPWNTLTAWAKEQIKKGEKLPLDVLGVTTGQIVKIKERAKPKKV